MGLYFKNTLVVDNFTDLDFYSFDETYNLNLKFNKNTVNEQ